MASRRHHPKRRRRSPRSRTRKNPRRRTNRRDRWNRARHRGKQLARAGPSRALAPSSTRSQWEVSMSVETTPQELANKNITQVIYGLYAASLIVGVTYFVAIVLNYVKKDD